MHAVAEKLNSKGSQVGKHKKEKVVKLVCYRNSIPWKIYHSKAFVLQTFKQPTQFQTIQIEFHRCP